MRVEDFPRPKNDNRRGVDWSASVYHPTGAAWISGSVNCRPCISSGSSCWMMGGILLRAVPAAADRRYHADRPPVSVGAKPGSIGGREEETLRRLIERSALLRDQQRTRPALRVAGRAPAADWLDIVIDNFIIDADKIIEMGGLPGCPR